MSPPPTFMFEIRLIEDKFIYLICDPVLWWMLSCLSTCCRALGVKGVPIPQVTVWTGQKKPNGKRSLSARSVSLFHNIHFWINILVPCLVIFRQPPSVCLLRQAFCLCDTILPYSSFANSCNILCRSQITVKIHKNTYVPIKLMYNPVQGSSYF